MTPTGRTLEALRARGWLCDVVERWLIIPARKGHPGKKIRKDCFGVGDILAAHPLDKKILLVQATSRDNIGARVAKAKGRALNLRKWLAAGALFQVWGWGIVGGRWQVKIVELTGDDLEGVVLEEPRRRIADRHKQGELFDGNGQRTT